MERRNSNSTQNHSLDTEYPGNLVNYNDVELMMGYNDRERESSFRMDNNFDPKSKQITASIKIEEDKSTRAMYKISPRGDRIACGRRCSKDLGNLGVSMNKFDEMEVEPLGRNFLTQDRDFQGLTSYAWRPEGGRQENEVVSLAYYGGFLEHWDSKESRGSNDR